MGSKERDRGARGERLLRDFLNSHGLDVKRGSCFRHESDLIGLIGIHVECKFVDRLNLRKAMEQAEEEAQKRKDGIPVVFHKTTRKPWLVTMRGEDWVMMYKLALGRAIDDSEGHSTSGN